MEVFFLMVASVFGTAFSHLGNDDEATDTGTETDTTDSSDSSDGGGIRDLAEYIAENYTEEFTGQNEADTVDATEDPENQAFFLLDGADSLTATEGNDYAEGDGGNDLLTMQQGNDIALGGAGADTILGDRGNDTLLGGGGDDEIDGGKGADVVDGGNGNDTIIGGNAADSLAGGAGNDLIYSDLASTEQSTFDGADTLSGGAGDDSLHVAGGDVANGGEGADSFFINATETVDGVAAIQDFDASEDLLLVQYDQDAEDSPSLGVVAAEDGTGVFISFNGVNVALVEGVTELNADEIQLVPAGAAEQTAP